MPETIRGRVVYGRKRHDFTYKDVLRIIRAVDPKDESPGQALKDLGNAWAAALAVFADVLKAFKMILPQDRIFWANRIVLDLLSMVLELVSYLPSTIGRLLGSAVEWMENLLGKRSNQDG